MNKKVNLFNQHSVFTFFCVKNIFYKGENFVYVNDLVDGTLVRYFVVFTDTVTASQGYLFMIKEIEEQKNKKEIVINMKEFFYEVHLDV